MSLRRLLFLAFLIFPIWNAPAFAQGVVCPAGTLGCSAGGGGVTSGAAVPTCTAYSVITIDASGNLKCDPAAVVNGSVSTAGRSILTIQDTISGSSATSNFMNITGTFPATLSADTNAFRLALTTVNQNQNQNGIYSTLSGNIGAGGLVAAIRGDIAASNAGAYAGGVLGVSSGSAAENVGVHGVASGGTGNIGGFFHLSSITTPSGTAALVADNRNIAANIFEARDNGTAVFTIADGGAITATGAYNGNGGGIYSYNSGGFGFANNGGSSTTPLIRIETALTPDALTFDTDTTSASIHISERADIGFDFQNACTTGLGTAACTDPTLIVHSHNQDTGEFLSMAHDGKAGVIVGGNSTVLDGTIRLGGTVTLTESSATTVLTIPVAVSTGTGGEIMYTVEAKDATNTQVRRGSVRYAVANNSSGTETCGVYGVDNAVTVNPAQTNDGSGAGAITSGTLTYGWTSDTTGTNNCVLKLNAVSSLTQTTFQIHYTVIQSGPGVPTGGD